MAIIWPNWNPIRKQKWQKTRISPLKRTIAYAELLAIVCWVSKRTIMKYFSNEKLTLSNPRAVRKFLEDRLKKFWNLQWPDKTQKTRYNWHEEKLPIQWPSIPTKTRKHSIEKSK